jgi:AbrB family looped-hinge helix DNA binding protein
MTTTVTTRGQTVIPAEIRQRHGISEGSRIAWVDDGDTIRVIPIAADPVEALYGSAKGEGLYDRLMEERADERTRERESDGR